MGGVIFWDGLTSKRKTNPFITDKTIPGQELQTDKVFIYGDNFIYGVGEMWERNTATTDYNFLLEKGTYKTCFIDEIIISLNKFLLGT